MKREEADTATGAGKSVWTLTPSRSEELLSFENLPACIRDSEEAENTCPALPATIAVLTLSEWRICCFYVK